MRGIILAALSILLATGAAAQTVHLGLVERWFFVLSHLQDARLCIRDDDPLRPGLETLARDTTQRATRAIGSDYEKGMLAGRLIELARIRGEASLDEDACQRILAGLARGLLRMQLH
ncbi:hypothetical protein [Falsiroseomonas oryzae]|uniref:hypothetical protein n=1 Tax=Falsiroseomonas oryzae TaxID=2766473 RepID=UPI0022EA2A97|nr:hypothetical protein [Roseomonas sp. MO-31]